MVITIVGREDGDLASLSLTKFQVDRPPERYVSYINQNVLRIQSAIQVD